MSQSSEQNPAAHCAWEFEPSFDRGVGLLWGSRRHESSGSSGRSDGRSGRRDRHHVTFERQHRGVHRPRGPRYSLARESEDRLRHDELLTRGRTTRQCCWGGAGTHDPRTQEFGEMRSTFVWHGNAHLPYCTLQWCVPHET